MTVLETVADRQAKWSATADALKGTIDQARRSVFVLSILGALAASSIVGVTETGPMIVAAVASTTVPPVIFIPQTPPVWPWRTVSGRPLAASQRLTRPSRPAPAPPQERIRLPA